MITLWIKRVVGWDGVLPLAVWTAPRAVAVIAPKNWDVVLPLALALPIAAFLIRMRVGWAAIESNACGPRTRSAQHFLFSIGIFVLLMLDALTIVLHDMLRFTLEDVLAFGSMFAVYLSLMVIAMYPGRRYAESEYASSGFEAD